MVTGRDRASWWLIALGWTGVTASFWTWWLHQAGHGTPWLYWPQTIAQLYLTTALPTFFFYYIYKMRRPVERVPQAGMRVALITLCVPGHESLEVIRKQLESLRSVDYEHDSWVLDEGASPEVEALAKILGIRYFTRKGVARWNEPGPPFQAKTKAGNVNAWLDHVRDLGLDYDVFVQFDIDHRPRRDYLHRVLGYFRDHNVAWVQAPSVCGNLDNWAARGLAEQDMIFQGPLQMGFYGATSTPFIVGSHTSYRTSAIREIGGFQPTRAEDHLDTVVLAAHGYRGVYVPELIAVGDGPHDFATYLRQQFAWAHSMIQIFLRHTPRLLGRYTFRQALQFLMCQSWYTLWSVSLAVLWVLPTVALLTHTPIAGVSIGRFLVFFLPVPLMSIMMWRWSRRWFQPVGLRLSWRGMLLEIARWPVVLWALIIVLLGISRSYMITPKGV
ncbi:MAG: glycosyltransferase family 2 protein, partial [Gaiellales bacterium]